MASNPTSNTRYNPLLRQFVPNVITGETHVVSELDFLPGVFGFWLDESPLPTVLPVVTKGMTGYTITNGGASQTVGAGEIFIDFSEMMGLCIVQAVEDGETFTVNYSGIGAPTNQESILAIQQLILDAKVSRDGSLAMTGNLNMDSNKIVNLANGTNSGDAVNFAQLSSFANSAWDVTGTVSQANTTTVTLPSAGTWFYIVNSAFGIVSATGGMYPNNQTPGIEGVTQIIGITSTNLALVGGNGLGSAPFSLKGFKIL
jgi:hypothetical protein